MPLAPSHGAWSGQKWPKSPDEPSAESYGIHGTPQPQSVSKTESHGCIRLTNWDALALARLVHKGTPVDFID
jgi:lipoprotein-anchoring transpeptidase ErfK/SrfK